LAAAGIERWTLHADPSASQEAIDRRQRWMQLKPEP
jgi:hypothetical protein